MTTTSQQPQSPLQHLQDEVHRRSLSDPASFWAEQAAQLHWHKKPSSILTRSTRTLPSAGSGEAGAAIEHPDWEWFRGGEISTCYNCVDRHVRAGHGDQPAIYYDSPVTGDGGVKQTITYAQLLDEVEVAAGALREEGVRRGDVVLIYMPMIPAALIGILAAVRLGAVHAVVFGGFAAASLAQRIDASRPAAVLAASCGVIGAGKPPLAYQPLVREAVRLARHKPSRVLVWQRPEVAGLRWDGVDRAAGERDWGKVLSSCRARGIRADCVPVGASDPVYVIYTSGTTGAPKGVVRDAGGHAVGLHLSITYLFGIRGPGDVIYTASDIGWVVGHSYIIYAPLLAGAATVLFEGKPVGTPDASTFWRIVSDYKVTTLSTAPTALRAIKRDDPHNHHLKRIGQQGGLRTLKALFLAGERSEPSIVTMYQELLREYGAPSGSLVIDNWWSSEAGSPISGISLLPHAAGSRKATGPKDHQLQLPPVKPGSAGKPMPGFDVRVVDDEGNEVKPGKMGNIVLAVPLAPTGFRTLWEDEERFYKSYLKRFNGKWIDTGGEWCFIPVFHIYSNEQENETLCTDQS
ncbi:hypothetical protein SLS62_007161 [Diatrype stigma]|uniref:Uncharacterized protein n=1 Tax=Diatrype stigma TaxID=117547 RepID=A0AAN9UNM2_9PEZI